MLKKLISIALLIIAPIISSKAFYEYVNVRYFSQAPSYPFGKELMKSLQTSDVHYLSSYQNELLSIGIVFLAISIIAFVSSFIKTLVNLIWIALLILLAYFIGHNIFGLSFPFRN